MKMKKKKEGEKYEKNKDDNYMEKRKKGWKIGENNKSIREEMNREE